MTDLPASDRARLVEVVQRRLGPRGAAEALVDAYLVASVRQAFQRTTQDAPIPTTLTVERTVLLLEICRALGRVVDDREVQALLRVGAMQARSIRRSLLATFSDSTDELVTAWALDGATNAGRRKGDTYAGTAVVFGSKEKRDAFIAELTRSGFSCDVDEGDRLHPWVALVGDEFELPKLNSRSDGS